ncbi:M23 family metallopeptidase [Labedella phragmitis]|uniref:M23 family metallopeptidase n=1 Tax=Labedella phragmitis TaxID=2498849 RepID=A0A444PYH1_9MICO|nr:M23 family metallopeptidase [Labedella phragmitis]RWZ52942.1 M23 family metallopeptidase [Labedella phragmitis]
MRHPVPSPPRKPSGELAGSGFGPREAPTEGASTFHAAQDYPVGAGTPFLAIADAVVQSVFWTDKGGWWITCRRPNGDTFGGCHLREKPAFKPGAVVKEGRTIGHVGSTGSATTGPHLHFTVRVNGVAVDPAAYIERGALSAPAPSNPTTPNKEDEEMPLIIQYGKTITVAGGGWKHSFPSRESYDAWRGVWEEQHGQKLPEPKTVSAFTRKAIIRAAS